MTMFVQLICPNRNEQEKNEIYQVLGLLCKREQIQIEERLDCVEILVCPQGKIQVTEKGKDVFLSATTRFAGPGFHAFVVEFFFDLQEEIEGNYEFKDDLNYDGDFDALCSIYEDEIVYLKDLLLKNSDMQTQNYMYEQTYFLPLNDSHSILTPIGKIDKEEFKQMDEKSLLPYFYIWNEWDKDAQFYKNAALFELCNYGAGKYTLMNESTLKHANQICDYIECAYQMDASISLPLKEYKYLCQQLERLNKCANGVQMEQEIYQYRLKEVYHLFSNVKVVCHGWAERSYDPVSKALVLMAPYQKDTEWHYMIQASLYPYICTKQSQLEQGQSILYRNKQIQIQTLKEENHYEIEAIIKEKSTLYFHCVCQEEKYIPYLTQCIKESEFQLEMDQ